MARIARVVIPGYPHHIVQRGNRRQQTFFHDGDYRYYKDLLSHWCRRSGVEVWCYCLMPNHVHLIAVPQNEDSLRRAIGEVHRRYTLMVNTRENWRGHLWQGRFSSFVMDQRYLLAASRYIELNPVRAKLSRTPWEYRWSSASAHLEARDDGLVRVAPLGEMVKDWRMFLEIEQEEPLFDEFRIRERTGRPLGDDAFLSGLERIAGKPLKRQKPGPKPHELGGHHT